MKRVLFFVILILVSLLLGCTSTAQIQDVVVSPEETMEMPEPILEKLDELKDQENYQAFDLGGEILLFASLGEKTSQGYEVKLKKANVKDEKLYVQVNKLEPDKNKEQTEVITYPTALGKINSDGLPRQVVFIEGSDYSKVIEEVLVAPVIGKQESTINLYFANDEDSLKNETRSIDNLPNADTGKEVLVELFKGPQKENNLRKIIPEGTKVLKYSFDKDTAVVDLSKEISKVSPGTNETLVVYSMVNTLTELLGVEKVKFLVEGKELSTLAGTVSLKKPLTRNIEIAKNEILK